MKSKTDKKVGFMKAFEIYCGIEGSELLNENSIEWNKRR